MALSSTTWKKKVLETVVLLQICMGILSGKRQFHLTISLFVMMNLSEWWFSTCHWFKIRTIREQDIYLLRENKWNELKNQCTFYELTWCWEYRNDRVFVCNISLWFAMLIALCINFESLIYIHKTKLDQENARRVLVCTIDDIAVTWTNGSYV